MAKVGDEFRDVWAVSGSKVVAEGDAQIISDWLANDLDKVRVNSSGWMVLYRHRDTGQYWELSYPQVEIHGGGPRCLRCLGDDTSGWGQRQ